MPKKPLTRSQLVKKLDKTFKKYIRYKNSFLVDGEWHAQCITCDKFFPTKKIHGGHYIRCGVMTTRWDERNVHPQCAGCNTYNYGEVTLYRIFIVNRYGESVAKELDQALLDWKRGNVRPVPISWLRERVEWYSERLKELNI